LREELILMRDLAENIAILDAIRAEQLAVDTHNARANGDHDTAGEIDLAEYGYPRKILVCVSVGAVDTGGELDVTIRSGDETGNLD
jgi:transposase